MVVKKYLEPRYEAIFKAQSFSYRPGCSAHDAIKQCTQNCYRHSWVIDIDIKGFFDNLDHGVLQKLLEKEVPELWIRRYIQRWTEAPSEMDGEQSARSKGTPQGGVISPLLANIYLHYAFDEWMISEVKHQLFERYADDIIIHCESKADAEDLLLRIKDRLQMFGLELNDEKTCIVYCKQSNRKGIYAKVTFTFLGYDFKPRRGMSRLSREIFLGYGGGIGKQAKASIMAIMRGWNLDRWQHVNMVELAKMINPKLRGWINYYGAFNKTDMRPIFMNLNLILVKWWMKKYRTTALRKAMSKVGGIRKGNLDLFAHWKAGFWDWVY